MAKGTFIVFEGGGGSGKDTLIELLKKKLASRTDVVYTHVPGGTPFGEKIRELILSPEARDVHPRTELLLFLAAHTELIEKTIRPALAQGKLVVSNRFVLSTVAYQMYGRQQLMDFGVAREALNYITHGIVPDLCLYLDAPPEIAIARAGKRPETPHRFIEEELAFHERVREGYKKHLSEFARKTVTIDTSGAVDAAWKKTEEALQSFL